MKKLYQQTIVKHVIHPLTRFVGQQKSGSIVLGGSVLLAIVLANTAFSEAYFHFFEQRIGIAFNDRLYFNHSLHHWINDGLMSVFFFVVGLELKHEFIGGELSNIRQTILPIGAAIGGMIVPALLYLAFNHGAVSASGWGIPMATDIAFALGVLYLLGDRVPIAAKVFLTTLAVVDDLGAVVIIALFYTSEISFGNLGVGLLLLTVMFAANKSGVKNLLFYGIVGIGGVWTMFLLSGVHATIAAVLAAFMIPAEATLSEPAFMKKMCRQAADFRNTKGNDVRTLEEEQLHLLKEMQTTARLAVPPSQSLEHYLAPIVTFGIMPVFALANAGVSFDSVDFSTLWASSTMWGVFVGLLLGKSVGIIGVSLLLTRMGWAQFPSELTLRRLVGISFLAAIGFTMSMFISTLAFESAQLLLEAKIAIFGASVVGGLIGFLLLKR
ncbi:Na+/H+ antiporter NhaA [Alloprevotella sp. OH1205_COT-284]|uniref:Na+/H+ antiporter NhaA n=1 Tax=Alloprevotella sp. OH1205_COT-284 TaxID=2491043 RepID=UPI000F5DB6F5|nr:Na+/H+ antiporter NhaA [Alloprevotella sp. OH1205_COT-284]RRD79516.1 Na+/H+ antiporter NhaA [Alloprevotella sp. OH1205_COT-284]